MKRTDITVEDIIDLIDFNRDGDEEIYLAPNADEDTWVQIQTNSFILDSNVKDMKVDSLGVNDDRITIFLETEGASDGKKVY